jgi:hypothetical protein
VGDALGAAEVDGSKQIAVIVSIHLGSRQNSGFLCGDGLGTNRLATTSCIGGVVTPVLFRLRSIVIFHQFANVLI